MRGLKDSTNNCLEICDIRLLLKNFKNNDYFLKGSHIPRALGLLNTGLGQAWVLPKNLVVGRGRLQFCNLRLNMEIYGDQARIK